MFEFLYLHLGTQLKEINRNVAPKRRRIVVPLINEQTSSSLIIGPVVFVKPKGSSNQTSSCMKNVHLTNRVQNQSQRQLKINVYIVIRDYALPLIPRVYWGKTSRHPQSSISAQRLCIVILNKQVLVLLGLLRV